MTDENKDILITDLTQRLKYGVILSINKVGEEELYSIVRHRHTNNWFINGVNIDIIEVKPYLRSMSAMTKEEREIYYERWMPDGYNVDTFDWFHTHHFDYRGLIEKGLAIEAPNNMYKYDS